MNINIKCFTVAAGLGWAVACFIFGLTSSMDWGLGFVNVLSSIYIGYKPGFLGAIIGAIWGFFGGAVHGFLLSFFYNFFMEKMEK